MDFKSGFAEILTKPGNSQKLNLFKLTQNEVRVLVAKILLQAR